MITPTSYIRGTVLFVKYHPTEDFVVSLHGSPAVVTLRDVKMYKPFASVVPPTHDAQPLFSDTVFNDQLTIHDIREGSELILVDVGVWNVRTSAIHGGQVILSGGSGYKTTGCGGVSSKGFISTTATLPQRRKRTSMQ
jgi:hypothetical protein